MNRIYRFAGAPSFSSAEACRMRLRKKKRATPATSISLGADPNCIVDASGHHDIEKYPEKYAGIATLTLTQREADLIALANPGTRPPKALEALHPWLPPRKYIGDASSNHAQLLALLQRYGKHLFMPDEFCNQGWNTICNALGMISDLDTRFYSAWHLPLQDVYVLEETRPDRSVIAIDFNAMYAACMQYSFPDPSRMSVQTYDRPLGKNEKLPPGLFRCRLDGKHSPFIQKHSPFRHFFAGRYLGASLEHGIEIELNEFEIEFYRRHFPRLHLVDGIIADRSIRHPLAREVRRAHARRLNFRKQSNKPLEDCEKFKMTLMASCANRPDKEKRHFPNLNQALAYLRNNFGIFPHAGEPMSAFCLWLSGKKGITLREQANGMELIAPALRSASACFSLSQRIVARSRTLLLEYMEKLCQLLPELEICYCNIDSIHFSIPDTRLPMIMEQLETAVSLEMGGVKVEAISKHGLWLEPGRYWLYSDNVDKFSNLGISDGVHPFKEKKIYVTGRQIDSLHIPVRITIDLPGSSSDAKTAIRDEASALTRLRFVEITQDTSYNTILSMLERNRRETIPAKLRAFHQLKQRLAPLG
ncbi:hypothetical protein KESI111651_01805 [Kerstersia similis]